MTPMQNQPISAQKLEPLPSMEQPGWLLGLTLICIFLAVLTIALAIFLPRFRQVQEKSRSSLVQVSPKEDCLARIDQVVADYKAGKSTRDQALKDLAGIARRFASQAWSRDMSAKTLTEIKIQPRTSSTSQGLDLLRQTIDALYPPEFAPPAEMSGSSPVSVDQAAEWVRALIERWR